MMYPYDTASNARAISMVWVPDAAHKKRKQIIYLFVTGLDIANICIE